MVDCSEEDFVQLMQQVIYYTFSQRKVKKENMKKILYFTQVFLLKTKLFLYEMEISTFKIFNIA